MQVESRRTYAFAVPPDALWQALLRVDDYASWWPWLRHFEPGPLEPGARWSCVVQPPLPYAVAFDLVLTDVRVGASVAATVEGGLAGDARLEIAATRSGSRLWLTSSLAPAGPLLRMVARLTPPVARFGHDWILDTGFRQFSRAIAVEP